MKRAEITRSANAGGVTGSRRGRSTTRANSGPPPYHTRLRNHSIILVALGLTLAAAPVDADCEPEPITAETPTGIKGCTIYGEGTASMWGGPGVARNDCVWPWTGCQPIAIQSLDTGITIIVTPTMYGDLYSGTPDERIVDLDPSAVAALGLEPGRGLWRVKVEPFRGAASSITLLPDTAIRYTSMVGVSDESASIPQPRRLVLTPPDVAAFAYSWRVRP